MVRLSKKDDVRSAKCPPLNDARDFIFVQALTHDSALHTRDTIAYDYRVSTVSIPGQLKLNRLVRLNGQHCTKVLLNKSYQSVLPLQCPRDAVLLELLCI